MSVKVCYLLKGKRKKRINSKEKFPDDFFYGFFRLNEKIERDIIEQDELNITFHEGFLGRLGSLFQKLTGVHPWLMLSLLNAKNRRRLNSYDIVFSTINSHGIALALLKTLGLLRAKVIFMSMGSINYQTPRRHKKFYLYIFRNVLLATISKRERDYIKNLGYKGEVSYFPFGVDVDYWSQYPGEAGFEPSVHDIVGSEPYVFAIGNDLSRDYSQLLEAWKPEYPSLKIVTSLELPDSLPENVCSIKGDWRGKLISDEDIRSLYQNALFIVTPMKNTIQPSGQSVTLQAMSCGKPVILADIDGLWDPDVMKDGENCFLYSPGDITSLREKIETLNQKPELRKSMGERAYLAATQSFTAGGLATYLSDFILEIKN